MARNPLEIVAAALRMRPRTAGKSFVRDRGAHLVGWISVGVVFAMVAASAFFGLGASRSHARSPGSGAWLASLQRGTLVHVNGNSGQVDGRVQLPQPVKGPLELVQDGDDVLVLDRGTGLVSQIDPAQLSITQTQEFEGARLRLVGNGDVAYVIDEQAGTVQQIKSGSEEAEVIATGEPIALKTRIGGGKVGDDDVLWVLVPDRGEALPIVDGKAGTPVKVAEPGDTVRLTAADGRVAAVNTKSGRLIMLTTSGISMTMVLPTALLQVPARVLVPDKNPTPLIPLLDPGSGALVVVNTESGVVQAVNLDIAKGQQYGSPQVHASRVYIPDRSTGTVIVYDTGTAAFVAPIVVTEKPGELKVTSTNDKLWIDDDQNKLAVVVDEKGEPRKFDKDGKEVPDAGSKSPTPSNTPSDEPSPSGDDTDSPGPSSSTGTPPDDTPPSTQSDKPKPGDTDSKPPVDPSVDPPKKDPSPPVTVTVTETPTDTPTEAPSTNVPAPPAPPTQTGPTTSVPTSPAPGDTRTALPSAPGPGTPTDGDDSPSNPSNPSDTSDPEDPSGPITDEPTNTTTKPTTKTSGGTGTKTSGSGAPTSTTPPAKPGPPGSPKVESGAGKITITFTPSAGATPKHYELEGSPGLGGAVVTPKTVAAKPKKGEGYEFVVTSIDCKDDVPYSFKVVAVYDDQKLKSTESPAVHPCLAPTKPEIAKPELDNHKAELKWTASKPEAKVTYNVEWVGVGSAPNGSKETKTPSLTITKLVNFKEYKVTVTASNSAGSAKDTLTFDLSTKPRTYKVHNNRKVNGPLAIRTGPTTNSGGRAGQIPAGENEAITVYCQVDPGSNERLEDGSNKSSSVWDKVKYKGIEGYISDLYVNTPNSEKGTRSPDLWDCE